MDFSFDPRTEHKGTGAALVVAGLMAAVYWTTVALGGNLGRDEAVYFDQLAASFLRGRLDIEAPPVTHDLAYVGGRWYVPFPPGPALVLLPAVALLGPEVPFESSFVPVLGGLNVGLVYLGLTAMRRRRWIELDPSGVLWLAVLFGLGTVHWSVAVVPRVWFIAQVVTVAFLALAVWLAAARVNPLWVGLALAGAVLTRPHVGLALPFFLAELAARARDDPEPGWSFLSDATVLLAPLVIAAGGLLWYNQARFGAPLEFGYALANADPALAADLQAHGPFSLAFLARNFEAAFLRLPAFQAGYPFFTPDRQGLSIFFTTPALLYLFRRRPGGLWAWGAWGAIVLIQASLLLYYNTGWQQFGYRFSLDYLLLALCLVAANAGRRVSPALGLLIGLSVLVNARGVMWWLGW